MGYQVYAWGHRIDLHKDENVEAFGIVSLIGGPIANRILCNIVNLLNGAT